MISLIVLLILNYNLILSVERYHKREYELYLSTWIAEECVHDELEDWAWKADW
jgi:hypothetical protein